MQIAYNIVIGIVIAYIIWQRVKLQKIIGNINNGDRIAVVPKEHSNVTVVRKGDSVILTDEEGNDLDINKIVR